MARWKQDPGIDAWSAFLRAHAAVVPRVDADLRAQTGLPLTWYDVLLELNAAPQRRLRMQDLAAVVVLSRTRISRVVAELEAAALVQRQPNPDDGRSAYAALTDEGRTTLRRAAPIYLAAIRRHFVAAIDPDHLQAVEAALSGVVTGAERNPPAPDRG